jgi:hypothetical protein
MEGDEHDDQPTPQRNFFCANIFYFNLERRGGSEIWLRGLLWQPAKNEKNQYLTAYAQRNPENRMISNECHNLPHDES